MIDFEQVNFSQLGSWLSQLLVLLLISIASITVANAQSSRIEITVENPTGATLTNHTVKIELNSTNAPGFDFSGNGDDVVVFNEDITGLLDFYVESVDDVTDTAVIWVEIPSVPTSPDTTIFLDYGDTGLVGAPLSNAANTFVNNGFKYHTQNHGGADPGPETRAAAEALFDFDTVGTNSGEGCRSYSSLGPNVTSTFGSNSGYGIFIESQITVDQSTNYGFRYGGDMGHGGELYIDDVAIEADWTNDLWWSTNFTNADVLTGTRFLDAGTHDLKILGFERCCDGGVGFEFRIDVNNDGDFNDAGEGWQTLNTSASGVTLYAPSCPVTNVTLGPITTVPVTLSRYRTRKIGPFIDFKWMTADETFSAGFNLWAVVEQNDAEPELVQLNRNIVRSKRFDSMTNQRYRFYTRSTDFDFRIESVAISSVDINGVEEFFGPFALGEEYGEEYQAQAIDWDSIHRQYRQKMQQRGYVKVKHNWRKKRFVSKSNTTQNLRLTIAEDGVYRVTHNDLMAVGINWLGRSARKIAITQAGKTIPRFIGGSRRGRFNKNSYIDFVGLAAKGEDAIYSEKGQYILSLDHQKALPAGSVRRRPSQSQQWYYQTLTHNQKKEYVMSNPGAIPWMMDVMFRTASAVSKNYDFTIDQSSLLETHGALLDVNVAGITDMPSEDIDGDGKREPDHLVKIYINGQEQAIHQLVFEGQRKAKARIELPEKTLKLGVNTVTVEVADNGYSFDAVGVSSVTLSYPKQVPFERIGFFAQENQNDGFAFDARYRTEKIAYAYRKDHNLMRLRVSRVKGERGRYQIPLLASDDNFYFVGKPNLIAKPEQIEVLAKPDDINLTDTNLLIVSHPVFIGEELKDYVQQRRLQGVDSLIISTDDIAANYGTDVPLNKAIKAFLKDASSKIEYQSVLLIGGHSYDYNHYVHDQSITFIPTFYRAIGFSKFTPSDQPFVDFDNDGYPEKAIGRWPARSVENIKTIAAKSLKWASESVDRASNGHNLLLLADKTKQIDFGLDLDQLLSVQQNNDLVIGQVNRVYVDQVIQANPQASDLNAIVRDQVRTQIDENASQIFYNGHGSPGTWSFTGMLRSRDIANLENSSPFMVGSLGCYTTYYEEPTHNTLAHQFLFANQAGAVIIHGPAVVGSYERQKKLSTLISKKSTADISIGLAIHSAMRSLPINHSRAILNWSLLGDPTLPVQ